MTAKSTLLAVAIVAAALASPARVAQAAPVAPVQLAAGKTDLTPVTERRNHRRKNRYYRSGRHDSAGPYDNGYGAFAYQPQGNYEPDRSQPNWYFYGNNCPYHGASQYWWCH